MNKKDERIKELEGEKKAIYGECSGLKTDVDNLREKNDNLKEGGKLKNIALLCFILLTIGLPLAVYGGTNNIDNDAFCLNKLNVHFPEYEFESAYHLGVDVSEEYKNSCRGTYYTQNETSMVRDGLREIRDSKEETIYFKLIDWRDIDYLRSDFMQELAYWVGLIITILGIVIPICWLMAYCS